MPEAIAGGGGGGGGGGFVLVQFISSVSAAFWR
eukprot:COSAG06_NODE_20902_length_777_cov_0.964602_2_plen_32_part_01